MANKHSVLEFEKAIIGYVLQNKTMQNVFGYLEETDFTIEQHRIIFGVLNKLASEYADKHIEESVVLQYLINNDLLNKIGGYTALADLQSKAALSGNVSKFINGIREKTRLREISEAMNKMSKELISSKNVTSERVVEEIERQILSSIRDENVKDFIDSETLIKNTVDALEKRSTNEHITGVPSKFIDLDNLTSGFQKGDLIILAARPSMGKTAFAINLAINAAKENFNVVFFSLEMPAQQIMERVISSEASIDGTKLRRPATLSPNEWERIYAVQSKVNNYNFFVDDTSGIKVLELVWKVKALHRRKPLSLIVIDYLQLITTGTHSSDNRQSEVSHISRTLKTLARDLEVPVIALSQLSRKVESRESKVPMMSDLRESGAIEQDADLVAFLYREEYYNNDKEKEVSDYQHVDVIIGKHRNGPIGRVTLQFVPKLGLFSNYKGK